MPIEMEITSLQVLMETKLKEAEWVQARYDQLNLIEKKRLSTLCHGQLYQKIMIQAYNKKERPRQFKERELVLRWIFQINKILEENGYQISKAFM